MNKKTWKVLGAGGLALFMGIGTLCGVLIAPMNSAQVSTTGATSASNSANLAGAAQSPSRAPMPQENLVAGGEALELNPQIDETIFTTESGFEIKSHSVAGQTVANSKVQYFTLRSYNGTPLNWIILATSTTMAENSTPAGKAINADTSKQMLSMMTTSSLSANQMLCISQYAFNQATMTANGTARTKISKTGTQIVDEGFSAATGTTYIDQRSDYYATQPSLTISASNLATNCLNLGTTFGINGLYGSKIVKNTSFNSNYIFNMTTSQYATYVPSSCKIPYLVSATSTKTNLFTPDSATMTDSVSKTDVVINSTGGYDDYRSWSGSGTTTSKVSYVNSSGNAATINTHSCSVAVTNGSYVRTSKYGQYSVYLAGINFTYTLTTNNLTAAYRPAMVVDLSKF